MRQRFVEGLARALPFYYGWVIVACVCAASFARQGPAVATLSIFIAPMTTHFGWSMTEISLGATIGGVMGALAAPLIGPLLDRNGARAILCLAVLTTGVPLVLLGFTGSLAWFLVFYCIGRMNFAGPFDIGIYGSIVNWFVRLRTFVTSIITLALMSGLIAMPLITHFVMQAHGWRVAWFAVGATVLVIGLLPCWLLLVRRPEDLGLRPDGAMAAQATPITPAGPAGPADPADPADPGGGLTGAGLETAAPAPKAEPAFTRQQAVRTPAFWLLSLFTLLVYPVQAGVSLHQAPLMIERGLDPAVAAMAVSTFSAASALAGFAYGFWPRRIPMNFALVLSGLALGGASLAMNAIHSPTTAYGAAALFGVGIGGLVTMLPVSWADYFGRTSYGAIRGLALTVQVVAQAVGPLVSGGLHDLTGGYDTPLLVFAGLACAGAGAALLIRAPHTR